MDREKNRIFAALAKTVHSYKLYLLANFIMIAVAGSMIHQVDDTVQKQEFLFKQMLLQEAIAHFDTMVVTRSWNANYGGVFYKAKEGDLPNPYLRNNHIFSKDNELLIKINPAWMTRQISELSNQKSNYFYKITSLKPINPHNAPSGFEIEALRYFENRGAKNYYYQMNDTMSVFNFMGALKTEQSCLACHAEQGYKLGDVRGGIRVSIPTSNYQVKLHSIHDNAGVMKRWILLSGFIVMVLINGGIFLIRRHQRHIEELNATLEDKVEERTQELNTLYQHEKYLKELLKTIATVNELLITSFSMQTVLQNTMETLGKHPNYAFTWIGLVDEDLLEVVGHTNAEGNSIEQQSYHLSDYESDFGFKSAKSAMDQNRVLIEKLPDVYSIKLGESVYECSSCWMIVLPLRALKQNKPLGCLCVYSNREEGFEPEEIKLLENLVNDIGMSIHSIRQRTVLEMMELEKISNYEETILAFINIIEQRDSYTAGHTLRVAEYSRLIAQKMGIEEDQIVKLEKAAILHDIGKVVTPDAILLKPGQLNPLEYDLIKQHSEAGYRMLSTIDMYKDLAEIIRYHHARYDGKGYPITSESNPNEIPLLSRIMTVADAFDAMTTNRIYKGRKSVENALSEILKLAGTQFHPDVADAAMSALADVDIVYTTQLPDNELERRRFAYFFLDSLTDAYNENYLNLMMIKEENDQRCLNVIELVDMSSFNNAYGWGQGDGFLKQVAMALRTHFPDAMLFRYHGHKFILLFKQYHRLDEDEIASLNIFKDFNIKIIVQHYDLRDGVPEIGQS